MLKPNTFEIKNTKLTTTFEYRNSNSHLKNLHHVLNNKSIYNFNNCAYKLLTIKNQTKEHKFII